ncbi:hypothetical protein K7B09_13060 [Thermomonas sp. RSS23]|uniref:Integron gene cassette protein n=1 Tax=Thermomonas beijingensis TaxID=2872701 RepID=A0ABS7THC1_9GAMM|nr:hypothetical protein [Thermomonas beijingensis]MBZ4187252.1 hypothetical protein [Thermomonas beijingensis]
MTTYRFSLVLLALAIAAVGTPYPAASVEPVKMYAQDMVDRADYILVAKVTRTYDGQGPEKFADLEPVSLIKGTAPMTVMYKTGISEFDPACCETGASYLFFLQRTPNGSAVVVGGRGDAIKVTSDPPA